MVPKGWEVKTLEQAKITVTDGDRGKEYPKSSEFFDSGYCLFLSAKNVTKNGFSFLDTQFISKEKHTKLRKGVVKRGDIVLTTRGSVGQFAYYDHTVNFENIRINSGMVTLGCSNSELESDFFYALSKSSLISRQIDSAAFGSAQPQLTVKIIKSLKLPVPPLREQRKIAKILSTWDKAISTTERLIDNSSQQKKVLMQQLLTGKKRLLDESGKRFEGEWNKKTLAGICSKTISYGIVQTGEYVKDGVPCVRVVDLTQKTVSKNDMITTTDEINQSYNKTILESGEVMMALRGVVGLVRLVNEELVGSNITRGLARLAPKNELIKSDFFLWILRSSYVKNELMRKVGGSALQEISLTALRKVQIPFPSLEEQQKIATVLTNADKEIELLEQQLADLQQEKKALMQQLLTGKKRVKLND